jgi:hypothetical protein
MIKAIKSAFGPNMIRAGRVYSFSEEVEKDFVKAGFAVYVETEKRVVEHGETASIKQKRPRK